MQGDATSFNHILDSLSERFTVITFDQRGSGSSSKPGEKYTIVLLADDTAALMNALSIESVHVFGVSLGGIITAVSKMCIKGNKGINLKKPKYLISEIEYFFSEDQGRYIIEVDKNNLKKIMISLPKVCHDKDLSSSQIKMLKSPQVGGVLLFSDNFDQNIPVLFLQGFSGDVRPKNLAKCNNLLERVLTYINGSPRFKNFNIASYNNWLSNFKRKIDSLINKKNYELLSGEIKAAEVIINYSKINTKMY